jgi:Fic family protein
MTYIHQLPNWPNFQWHQEMLIEQLASVRHKQGRLIGRMEALGFELSAQASLEMLTKDVVKSSEIEGDILNKEQVRSSLARRLGMNIGTLIPASLHIEGVTQMMLDASQQYNAPLTIERLCAWHMLLFPTGRSGMADISVGAWRNDRVGPMQVVSGPIGRERVHYQAPSAEKLHDYMRVFLDWFENDESIDLVLKAGIAHLWFVTIHPFDDGNGRIARAIADLMLARSENITQRFYSMSMQICEERKIYYDILESTQKGDLDITSWLKWFLACLDRAFDKSENVRAMVTQKAKFWEMIAGRQPLNARQHLVINRLLDGFEGKLTSSKYAKLAKCSQDTALRDIDDLLKRGVLTKDTSGGRSTSYFIALS